MFSKEIIDAIRAAARANHWPESALLAVVECETSGDPFEQDNRTPRLLFERHKFYSEMKQHEPSKLQKAIAAGLAIPKWSRSTQYKDQGSSGNRLKLIAKARDLDEEVANRAASWGLGQTMGFNAERLKYENATAMVAELSKGIAEQIEAMVREIKASNIGRHLVSKNFAAFARVYNGAGYAQNQYDTRMAAADKVWERRLANPDFEAKPGKSITKVYQTKLKALNYPIGKVDGDWGDLTSGATSSFQRAQGLKITGHPNDETTEALDTTQFKREAAPARVEATVEDLRATGSQTIASADKGSLLSKITIGTGVLGGLEKTGALDQAQEVIGKVEAAKGVLDSVKDLAAGLAPYWWVGVIIVGFVAWQLYGNIIKRRLQDHQSGVHLG